MTITRLAEPKQSDQIHCNLAQITRLHQIGVGNPVFTSFTSLGPIWQKKDKVQLVRSVIPRLEINFPHMPDWPEFQIGARLLWLGQQGQAQWQS